MRGYIKDHRQELESDIWKMPPLYHRVWQWLKYKVNYEDAVVPFADGSKVLVKAGQHLTSIRKIAQGVGWYERGIWKEPNPKTISTVLEWLKNDGMITLNEGNSKYTLVTLVNWRFFQSEGNAKVTVTGYKEKELRNKELNDLKDIPPSEVTKPVNDKIQFADTVFLKQDEYDRLCNDFGKETTDLYIEMLDEWQTNNPKKKRVDHNKTIRVWIRKDAAKKKPLYPSNQQQRNEQQMDVLAQFYKEGAAREADGDSPAIGGHQDSVPQLPGY